jgi:hypothetical protein
VFCDYGRCCVGLRLRQGRETVLEIKFQKQKFNFPEEKLKFLKSKVQTTPSQNDSSS